MKPAASLDAWMPYFGDDIANAVRMFPKAIKWTYLECVWFYWSHTKCQGLEDDDEKLRELCQCPLGEWQRVKGMIFDNDKFFRLENGAWHQKRAREEYQKSTLISQARSQSGATGAAKRWQANGIADGKPDGKPIAKVCYPQSQSQSHIQPESQPAERESHHSSEEEVSDRNLPEYPNLELVKSYAVQIGLPDWKAADWFDEMEGVGWVDFNQRPIHNWQAILRRVKTNWEAKGRPSQQKQNAPKSPVNLMVHNDELKRIEARLKTLRERYDSNAGYTKADAEEIKKLNARKRELRDLLGVQV